MVENEQEKTNTISKLDANIESQEVSTDGDSGPWEETKRELAAKSEELQVTQDKYLRLAAEFENYKRRMQRDQRDYVRFANEELLKELLPIVDNLERAIRFSKESPASDALAQGVELTLKQFLETLAKFGVRSINSLGEMFDPARHQAVARLASDTAVVDSVVEEFQKGYLLHERVLRAAMVGVAIAKSGSGDTEPAASCEQGTPESSDKKPVDAHNIEEGESHG